MKIFKKIVAWLLLIMVASTIFGFSSQPAEESSEVSLGFVRTVLDFIPGISEMAPEKKDALAEGLENLARKLAHFTVFAALGVCSINLAFCYEENYKKFIYYVLLFCFLYAVSDEVHQLFTDGRACRISDVFIDFAGSSFGAGAFLFIKKQFINKSGGKSNEN